MSLQGMCATAECVVQVITWNRKWKLALVEIPTGGNSYA